MQIMVGGKRSWVYLCKNMVRLLMKHLLGLWMALQEICSFHPLNQYSSHQNSKTYMMLRRKHLHRQVFTLLMALYWHVCLYMKGKLLVKFQNPHLPLLLIVYPQALYGNNFLF